MAPAGHLSVALIAESPGRPAGLVGSTSGITAICNQMALADDGTFKVKGLSVVNGCQSLNTIL